MFGQFISRVRKISEFSQKQGKGFGKRATHHLPVSLEVHPPKGQIVTAGILFLI